MSKMPRSRSPFEMDQNVAVRQSLWIVVLGGLILLAFLIWRFYL